jgi:predicted alpha-1,2-mannosidase
VQLGELEMADPAVPTPTPTDGPYVGWMRDRYADGTWAPGFSPSTGTGFVEGSSAQYTWMVYSDVLSLADAMGGKAKAAERLDSFFRKPDGSFDLSATTSTRFDATNEPDIQTPYLYNYFGQAYKTQETVRAIVDGKWSDGIGGIPGNDDAGTMSAWYVFSALGLYPTVPTRAELSLTTPLFPHAVVHLANGKKLSIEAPQATAQARYVKSLRVDGDATSKAWLPASTINTGGHLLYVLSAEPSLKWGSGPNDAPPQN